MTPKHRSVSVRARLALTVAAGIAGSLLVAGCGIGGSPIADGTASAAAFVGKINGGPNPIQGATVKLYTTGVSGGANGGYGVGTFVQEANTIPNQPTGWDTAADGSFNFAGGYPCPAGQFLYLVSNGGDTGAGANPKAFLVAALGRCEDLFTSGKYTGGFIYLNELSTVAAAYALGNFTTITGSGSSAVIGIGASNANNASAGCVSGSGCAATAAAGLRHAFENAANLVNPFSPSANTTLAGNSEARVPAQLLNTIANSLVACVNTNGTSQACSIVFNATGTDYTNGNTFGAMVNLAKNPSLAGNPSNYNPTNFLQAATPQTNFYQPFLTTPPHDFSISITYPKLLGKATGVQGLTYPYSGTLDINDNYYVGNYDSADQNSANAVSFNSNGTLVSFTPDNPTQPTAIGASADALGNLFLVGFTDSVNGTTISRYTVNNTTGAIVPAADIFFETNDHPISAAVDRHNNLWYGTQINPTIAEVPQGSHNLSVYLGVNAPVTAIAIDPDQNVWLTNSSTNPAINAIGVLQNTGSVAAPTYTVGSPILTTLSDLSLSGISFSGSSSSFTAYVSNTGTIPGLTPVVPMIPMGSAEVTALTPGTSVAAGTAPVSNQTDGSGNVWAADGADIVQYASSASIPVRTLQPCSLPDATSTACTTTPYSGLQSLSIDSTGSVWFVSAGAGTVSEMIGSAAPAWPLLSLGLLGVPQ